MLAFLLLTFMEAPAPLHLLGSPQVRREIGLTPLASGRILALINRGNELKRGGVLTTEEARLLEEARRLQPPETFFLRAQRMLTPAQTHRVWEIQWQLSEPFLLNDAGFAFRLGVSSQQGARVRAKQERLFAGRDKPGYLERCREALYAELTATQVRRLRSELGRPFPDLRRITFDTRSYPMN